MDPVLIAIVLSVFSALVSLLGYIAPRTSNKVDDRIYQVIIALLQHAAGSGSQKSDEKK